MRKALLLVAGVVLIGGTLTACFGGPPPPPPPTEPRDVLVVGDSVGFSFGCVLGDGIPGVSQPGDCPARPGLTAQNESKGACTITPGTLALYNGGLASSPNCNTVEGARGRTWADAASHFVPKVVVINTAGWEVMDRWINAPAGTSNPPPDSQWGGPTNGPPGDRYHTAAAYYSNELLNAINTFRSVGAKVLLAIAPYFDPPEPQPLPSMLPPELQAFACMWWEPYDASPPTSQGECSGPWQSPFGASYRSSKVKTDQLNNIVMQVKNDWFAGDQNVMFFNFRKHFNGPSTAQNPNGQYTSWVCPPPDDATQAPIFTPDPSHPKCARNGNPQDLVPALLARAADQGHLSAAGDFEILLPYLEPCVKALIPVAGGDVSKCN